MAPSGAGVGGGHVERANPGHGTATGQALKINNLAAWDVYPSVGSEGGSRSTLDVMTTDYEAAMAAIQALVGPLPPDPEADARADRAVAVIHAQAAALGWVHQATGAYPAPPSVAQTIARTAARLRDVGTVAAEPDPDRVLIGVAAEALSAYRATAA